MSEFLDPLHEIHVHGTKLPHWQQPHAMQFVTFRLADAMPQEKLHSWKQDYQLWLLHHPKPWSPADEQEYRKHFVAKLEAWLDAGSGSCILAIPAVRQRLQATLERDQGTRAEFHAWVIMPNHVHLLFTPLVRLESLMKSWKGVSSRKIGRGPIWQGGYRDTMIRNEAHFARATRYIRRNPAGLRPNTFTLWQSPRALAVEA